MGKNNCVDFPFVLEGDGAIIDVGEMKREGMCNNAETFREKVAKLELGPDASG